MGCNANYDDDETWKNVPPKVTANVSVYSAFEEVQAYDLVSQYFAPNLYRPTALVINFMVALLKVTSLENNTLW